ncbi:MAG: hemolysin III family protein [Archangiaceae bacterium]|nr:hemolysin III family protein [Archangiaceae bacterium]
MNMPSTAALPPAKVKPLLRGSSHFIAFFVALAAGVMLVAFTPQRGAPRLGALVYAGGLALMLGLSGFYHRPTWSLGTRRIFKKLDHAGIFVQIAGTYTAFWTLAPPSLRSVPLLGVMWGCALAGAAVFSIFTDLHRAIRAGTYVAVGLSTLPLALALPQIVGRAATLVTVAGAGIYIAGAVVYARRWPNPNPRVFGYHEVFHLMVVLAAALHFGVIAHRQFAGAPEQRARSGPVSSPGWSAGAQLRASSR